MNARWVAITGNGAALRIGPLGLSVGRHTSCDLVLDDPRVSRRHLLLQPYGAAIKAVALSPNATLLNGKALNAPSEIGPADELTLPDGTTLRVRPADADDTIDARWALELGPRQAATLHEREVTVGGGWDDDLVIDGWPPAAVRLISGPRLELIARASGVVVADAPVASGERKQLSLGTTIAIGNRGIRVIAAGAPDETTLAPRVVIPQAATLEMLPVGGRLTLQLAGATRHVVLSERRFALVVALLAPPAPYHPGELVPDDEVFVRVWPRRDGVDRGDLNQLVHRLRGDLAAAGLDGARLVERPSSGGATRFVLASDARVESRL